MKRLAASFVIAGRSNMLKESDAREAAFLAAQSYRLRMSEYVNMTVLQSWYDSLDLNKIIANMQNKQQKRFYSKKLAQATEETAHEKEFAKLAYLSGDSPRIIDQPPLIYHYNDARNDEIRSRLENNMAAYLDYLSPERRGLLSPAATAVSHFKMILFQSISDLMFCSGTGPSGT